MKKWLIQVFGKTVCLLIFSISAAHASDLVITNVNIVDVKNERIQENSYIVVENGTITSIGDAAAVTERGRLESSLKSRGTTLDAKGAFALPGLIDSHVHLTSGPGGLIEHPDFPTEENWRQTWGARFPIYLRAYLASGVTTVLDTAEPFYVYRAVQDYIEQGNPSPRYLTLSPMITLPGGYGDGSGIASALISNEQDIEATIDKTAALGSIGIKLTIEKGFSPISWHQLPRLAPELLDEIVKQANDAGLIVYAHATSVEDMETAVDVGAHALLHTLVHRNGAVLPPEFVKRMASNNIYQVSTLSTMDADLGMYNSLLLDDPLTQIVVPPIDIDRARDKEMALASKRLAVSYGVPQLPAFTLDLIAKFFYTQQDLENALATAMEAINQLNKAGVAIVMGSDTVQPYSIYYFHGIRSLREIELLGAAGLSEYEAIRAATINGAAMLGLAHRLGSIEQGKLADLVLVRENPIEDLSALRKVAWTVKNGVAKTPREWMTSTSSSSNLLSSAGFTPDE